MTTRTKLSGTVDVSAALLWAAGWRARQEGDSSIGDRIAAVLEKSASARPEKPSYLSSPLDDRPRKLLELATSGMSNSTIRFTRDWLDIALASVLCADTTLKGFKLYSDRSAVEAGFFRVRRDVEYVERVTDKARDDALFAELLPASLAKSVLAALTPFEQHRTRLLTPSSGDALLLIEAPALRERMPGVSTHGCTIELWKPSPSGKPGQRRLGKAKLKASGRTAYALDGVSPEAALELTAAAIAGHWLHLEADRFRLLGKLPDLTTDGAASPAGVTPTACFDAPFDEHGVIVSTPADLARSLHSRYSWFAPETPSSWMRLVPSE